MGATAERASRGEKTTQARRGLMPLSLAGNLPPARALWSNRCDCPHYLVGATLVVARACARGRRQQGDHKGRPYRVGRQRGSVQPWRALKRRWGLLMI